MKRFADLFDALDGTTSTAEKVAAMAAYFRDAPPEDGAWGLHALLGLRPKRLLGVRKLATWAQALADVPEWLFEACHASTGDLAEAIALLIPPAASESWPGLAQLSTELRGLARLDEEGQRVWVLALWARLPSRGIFLATKLLTGALRVGVSQTLVTRALAEALGLNGAVVTDRLMGSWTPSPTFFSELAGAPRAAEPARPYPFALAAPLDEAVETLGPITEWLAEWKWDGIRCQLLRRDGRAWLWSRGEELVTDRFPELVEAAARLPDGVVLDGEVLAWGDERPLPFQALQTRIGRKVLSPKVLAAAPVVLVAYDCLEEGGTDRRAEPMHARRAWVEALVARAADPRLRVSPRVEAESWPALVALRADSRARGVEGLMLKHVDAPYVAGRHRGGFWKWKIEPHTVDAVLVYAQPGSGKRSNLYTDYTFAVWSGAELVTVAKAYSGLDNAEIEQLDRWIRQHTLEKFGPVRRVEPTHVFELAYEGIAASTRHKSGVALRFPRISRWRTDKPAAEADRLETLRALVSSG